MCRSALLEVILTVSGWPTYLDLSDQSKPPKRVADVERPPKGRRPLCGVGRAVGRGELGGHGVGEGAERREFDGGTAVEGLVARVRPLGNDAGEEVTDESAGAVLLAMLATTLTRSHSTMVTGRLLLPT